MMDDSIKAGLSALDEQVSKFEEEAYGSHSLSASSPNQNSDDATAVDRQLEIARTLQQQYAGDKPAESHADSESETSYSSDFSSDARSGSNAGSPPRQRPSSRQRTPPAQTLVAENNQAGVAIAVTPTVAATRIQAFARRIKAKMAVAARRRERQLMLEAQSRLDEENVAALQIQSAFRGHNRRSGNQADDQVKPVTPPVAIAVDGNRPSSQPEAAVAATRIQSAFRSHNVRSRTSAQRREQELEAEAQGMMQEQHLAAVKVQSTYRMHQGKKRAREMSRLKRRESAGKTFGNKLSVPDADGVPQNIRVAANPKPSPTSRPQAALTIQCFVRCRKACVDVAKRSAARVQIQGQDVRNQAAKVIQAAFRKHRGRVRSAPALKARRARYLNIIRNEAALCIQCAARVRMAKRKVAKRRAELNKPAISKKPETTGLSAQPVETSAPNSRKALYASPVAKKAAITIQLMFRCYAARQITKTKRRLRKAVWDQSIEADSVCVIQSFGRALESSNQKNRRNTIFRAAVVQQFCQCFLARALVNRHRLRRIEQQRQWEMENARRVALDKLNRSVTLVQQFCRGVLPSRDRLEKRVQRFVHASVFQRFARARVSNLRREQRKALRVRRQIAAATIQRCFRSYRARKRVAIYARSRKAAARREVRNAAVIVIQSAFRGLHSRKRVSELHGFERTRRRLRIRNEAAAAIQALYRGHAARVKMDHYRRMKALHVPVTSTETIGIDEFGWGLPAFMSDDPNGLWTSGNQSPVSPMSATRNRQLFALIYSPDRHLHAPAHAFHRGSGGSVPASGRESEGQNTTMQLSNLFLITRDSAGLPSIRDVPTEISATILPTILPFAGIDPLSTDRSQLTEAMGLTGRDLKPNEGALVVVEKQNEIVEEVKDDPTDVDSMERDFMQVLGVRRRYQTGLIQRKQRAEAVAKMHEQDSKRTDMNFRRWMGGLIPTRTARTLPSSYAWLRLSKEDKQRKADDRRLVQDNHQTTHQHQVQRIARHFAIGARMAADSRVIERHAVMALQIRTGFFEKDEEKRRCEIVGEWFEEWQYLKSHWKKYCASVLQKHLTAHRLQSDAIARHAIMFARKMRSVALHFEEQRQHMIAVEMLGRGRIRETEWAAFTRIQDDWTTVTLITPVMHIQRTARTQNAKSKVAQLRAMQLNREEQQTMTRVKWLQVQALIRHESVKRSDILMEEQKKRAQTIVEPAMRYARRLGTPMSLDGEVPSSRDSMTPAYSSAGLTPTAASSPLPAVLAKNGKRLPSFMALSNPQTPPQAVQDSYLAATTFYEFTRHTDHDIFWHWLQLALIADRLLALHSLQCSDIEEEERKARLELCREFEGLLASSLLGMSGISGETPNDWRVTSLNVSSYDGSRAVTPATAVPPLAGVSGSSVAAARVLAATTPSAIPTSAAAAAPIAPTASSQGIRPVSSQAESSTSSTSSSVTLQQLQQMAQDHLHELQAQFAAATVVKQTKDHAHHHHQRHHGGAGKAGGGAGGLPSVEPGNTLFAREAWASSPSAAMSPHPGLPPLRPKLGL